MDQQDVCILLGLNRAKQEVRRAARELTDTSEVLSRWGQSLSPVDSRWVTATLAWQKHAHQGVIGYFDDAYPSALREIHNPPWLLYYRGRQELLATQCVALVGSRKASHSALQMTDWLASACVDAGLTVVSGLAMGVDAQAHQSSLEKGATIAVLGTGIDQVYPRRNRKLHELIAHQGLLISEFPPGISARMDHFPRRNRIISGISKGVVVIEAAERSGSISTAIAALSENREVGAVPGSVFDKGNAGCHQLLKQGATVVTEPRDLLRWFAIADAKADTEPSLEQQGCLANDQLFASLSAEPTSVDALVANTGLTAAAITEQLLHWELAGLVAAVTGGYVKVGRR